MRLVFVSPELTETMRADENSQQGQLSSTLILVWPMLNGKRKGGFDE